MCQSDYGNFFASTLIEKSAFFLGVEHRPVSVRGQHELVTCACGIPLRRTQIPIMALNYPGYLSFDRARRMFIFQGAHFFWPSIEFHYFGVEHWPWHARYQKNPYVCIWWYMMSLIYNWWQDGESCGMNNMSNIYLLIESNIIHQSAAVLTKH